MPGDFKCSIGAIGALLGMMSGYASGCASDATDDAELLDEGEGITTQMGPMTLKGALKPLAKVVDKHRTVHFFESPDGNILEAEYGQLDPNDLPADEPQDLTSEERYQRLSGSRAPQALVQAQARLDARRRALPPRTELTRGRVAVLPGDDAQSEKSTGSQVNGDHSRSWFRNNYCQPTDRNYFWYDRIDTSKFEGWGLNHMRTAVYNASPSWATSGINVNLLYREKTVPLVFGEYVGGFLASLQPGWYYAIRASTNLDAEGSSWASTMNDEPGELYDHCTNFRY